MKLLVTGMDGFTGRYFTGMARAAGHEVVGLHSDLMSREALQREIAETAPEAVVHLAAISFVGHLEVSAFYDVNVLGTLNLLDALVALEKPPKRVLLVSSANVYGNCDQSPIKESQSPVPVNAYAVSKLAMENMAWTYLDKLPLFCVRPFNYIGPGQAVSFIIPKLMDHFVRRASVVELGNLEVEREFNDVRFVCQVYLQLLEKAMPGEIYNVCSGQPVALKAVLEWMMKITGHYLQVTVNPIFVRANEIARLCGSPEKLLNVIDEVRQPTLQETLQWMHDQAVCA